jgi:hypothetical protein
MKMKSDRPLLVNGEPCTEFETTEHHGRELIHAGLAAEVGEKSGPAQASKPAAPKTK